MLAAAVLLQACAARGGRVGKAPPPEAPPQTCSGPDAPGTPVLDRSRGFLERRTCSTALWLDGLFGDKRNIDAARRTHGYLETSLEYSEFYGTESATRFRVESELPNLQDRLSVYFGRDDEEEVARDRSEDFALRSRFGEVEERQWLGGIGYTLPDRRGLSTKLNVGFANLRNPRMYVQAKLYYMLLDDEQHQLQLRLTPFYNTRDGEGVTTGFNYHYLLGENLLLRYTAAGTMSRRSEGLSWINALMLYVNLKNERGLTYELYVSGETDEDEPLREYGLRQIYTHPLVRDKLYGEFLAGYGWPRTDPAAERNGAYELGVSLRIPFGPQSRP